MHRHLPTIITAAVLLGLLTLAATFAVTAWGRSTAQMSSHSWIALGLGVVFSILVGCGLMALVFYSNRRGYDEPATMTNPDRELP
jgi:membrane protein implicated in regulation of membrane protease activity